MEGAPTKSRGESAIGRVKANGTYTLSASPRPNQNRSNPRADVKADKHKACLSAPGSQDIGLPEAYKVATRTPLEVTVEPKGQTINTES